MFIRRLKTNLLIASVEYLLPILIPDHWYLIIFPFVLHSTTFIFTDDDLVPLDTNASPGLANCALCGIASADFPTIFPFHSTSPTQFSYISIDDSLAYILLKATKQHQ
jgi:hypothetical protein